jgi:hypothetical protein
MSAGLLGGSPHRAHTKLPTRTRIARQDRRVRLIITSRPLAHRCPPKPLAGEYYMGTAGIAKKKHGSCGPCFSPLASSAVDITLQGVWHGRRCSLALGPCAPTSQNRQCIRSHQSAQNEQLHQHLLHDPLLCYPFSDIALCVPNLMPLFKFNCHFDVGKRNTNGSPLASIPYI